MCATSFAIDARAQQDAGDQASCVDAYTQGQELEQAGALRSARDRFLVCARDPCSKVLTKDCMQWLDEVERKIPSLVFVVNDAAGREQNDVDVWIDGAPVASRSGRAVEVDPGDHTVRVVARSGRSVEEHVVAREGDKSRRITVILPAAPPSPPPAEPGGEQRTRVLPWPVYPLVVLGGLSLGSFAYFGIRGVSSRADLESCRGSCAEDRVSATRTSLLLADISLGVSVVSLGVATYLWLTTKPTTAH
jgi:hypothetical protein